MDDFFQRICSADSVPFHAVEKFSDSGFLLIPGPFSGSSLNQVAEAYDRLMASASGPDFKASSTTVRMSDLLSFDSIFDEIFLYKPLLQVCNSFLREPFKLSSLLARTLKARTPAQELHADLPRDSKDAPLFGFIFMIDPFREENGATRFVPGSQRWHDLPSSRVVDTRLKYPGEVLGCGESGTMILFDGAIWHGHSANVTPCVRRSIQGYFVRRNARSGCDFRSCLSNTAQARMSSLARYLLVLDEKLP